MPSNVLQIEIEYNDVVAMEAEQDWLVDALSESEHVRYVCIKHDGRITKEVRFEDGE